MRSASLIRSPEGFAARYGYNRQIMHQLANDTLLRVLHNPKDPRASSALSTYANKFSDDPCAIAHAQRIEASRLRKLSRLDAAESLIGQTLSTCSYCNADALVRLATVHFTRTLTSASGDFSAALTAAEEAVHIFDNLVDEAVGEPVSVARSAALQILALTQFQQSKAGQEQRVALRGLQESIPLITIPESGDFHPSLPTEALRKRICRTNFFNLALGLTLTNEAKNVADAFEMLPAIKRQFSRRRAPLDFFRVEWFEARLKATKHNTISPREQNRYKFRKRIENKLVKVYAGMLEHGNPADAVCVLLDQVSLPWKEDHEAPGLIAAALAPKGRELAEQVAKQLKAMDPELHQRVMELKEAAEGNNALRVRSRIRQLYDELHAAGSWPRFAAWDATPKLRHRRRTA